MPVISVFYGIKIRMHYGDHSPPHFHAVYGECKAVFELRTLAMSEGDLPRRAKELVLLWAMEHRSELEDNWRRIEQDEPLHKIAPLE